jgi:hypothetical protein
MKTHIVPAIIAAAALSTFAGCATDTVGASDPLATDTAAVCANPEGTNAGIAALVGAISLELHRWNITTDFTIVRGYNNQEQLALTSAGLAACGGTGCPMTTNMLKLQDSRVDLQAVFDGTKMSSWSFASRLVSGYRLQQSCQSGGWCPFVTGHVFTWTPSGAYTGYTITPGACDVIYRLNVNRNTAGNHAPLTDAERAGLANALKWTASNGPNPYIAFNAQPGLSTIDVDPPGGGLPSGTQTTGSDICQKFSMTNLNTPPTPCTCATNNIYMNGVLKNDVAQTPNTYFCRCPAGVTCM